MGRNRNRNHLSVISPQLDFEGVMDFGYNEFKSVYQQLNSITRQTKLVATPCWVGHFSSLSVGFDWISSDYSGGNNCGLNPQGSLWRWSYLLSSRLVDRRSWECAGQFLDGVDPGWSKSYIPWPRAVNAFHEGWAYDQGILFVGCPWNVHKHHWLGGLIREF